MRNSVTNEGAAALRCPRCNKPWPASATRCPEDGADLQPTAPHDLHRMDTFVLPSGRPRDESPTVAVPDGTNVDTSPALESATGAVERGQHAPTGLMPANGYVAPVVDRGPSHEPNHFDPFNSDIRTDRAPRPRYDVPFARPAGATSSDPPTMFVRRPETHIELPPGSMVGDEYEIEHRLGAGAMGEVYAARHVKLGKRVAIKVISPKLSEDSAAIERFAQEARTLAQMHHPGLVDVVGFGELADRRAYFVMEYLSGTSLYDRLERGRLDRDEALDIFGQMARALEAAHAHSVVHRDLKPENTFLARVTNEERPVVKLLDFGLARLIVDVDRRTERTQSGVVIGTAMYLSPEQARGPDVDGRTDVYALGCVGYELFLGCHPFHEARTVAALIAAHMHETPPMPTSIDPNIPAALDLMLFAMLAKDPSYRPSLAQVRSMVASVRSGATSAARATTAPVVHRPRGGQAWLGVLVAFALIVGIAIGARGFGSTSHPITVRSPDGNEVIPPVTSSPRAIAVPAAMIDADAGNPVSVPVMDASVSMPTRPTSPQPRSTSRVADAAIAEEASHSSTPPVDATTSPEVAPELPRSLSLINPEITKPHVIPAEIPGTEKPPQRPVTPTPPTPPPGRDDTINPFRKGSGSR